MKLILGSASANRKKVLERMGYEFEVLAADIDEKAVRSDNVRKLPLLIARAKAEALSPRIKEAAVLITADQVTVWNNEMREKPRDASEARAFLKTLSHLRLPSFSFNGIVVTNTANGRREEASDASYTLFRPIPDEVIAELIASGDVFKWAGAYTPEHPLLLPFIERIEGDEGSVLGLPMNLTRRLLEKAVA